MYVADFFIDSAFDIVCHLFNYIKGLLLIDCVLVVINHSRSDASGSGIGV